MKCQKCAKPAVVHLTEVITEKGPQGMGEVKTAVEIHLCLDHAVTAGLLTPLPGAGGAGGAGSETVSIQSLSGKKGELDSPAAIVPVPSEETGMTLARERPLETCPVCGMTWAQFKQGGIMGCGHDYDLFAPRLLPLLKRAQEGSIDHVGKVPTRKKREVGDQKVVTLRLRRELQKAVDAENYEQAAQVRDKLRSLEKN